MNSPVKNKKNLINIDTQFMIGKDLFVCPNLSPTDTLVTCSFPAGTWCSLISGTERTRTGHVRTRPSKILVRPVHRFMFGHV